VNRASPIIFDAVKATVLLLLAAIVQVSIVNSFELVEGRADIVLLALVGLALLRGPVFGAGAGFFAGLVIDTATLGTLGLTSLLLTLAGYTAGRIGEATSNHQNPRARSLIAVTLLTVAVEIGAMIVHGLLGDSVSPGAVVVRVLLPTLALNLALAIPSYAFCRRLFPSPPKRQRDREVAVA
jgi:rod shape-determining protein MreD